MKNNITAKIERESGSTGLWIAIKHEFDPIENTTMAISEDEIPAILEACKKYLAKKTTK